MMSAQLIAPLVMAVVSGLLSGGAFQYLRTRSLNRKDDAEAQVTLAGGWQAYAARLESRLREAETTVDQLKVECAQARAQISRLEADESHRGLMVISLRRERDDLLSRVADLERRLDSSGGGGNIA